MDGETASMEAAPTVTLHLGDCLDVLRTMEPDRFDAVVTDPPYGLEFMGKAWDAPWKSGRLAGPTDGRNTANPLVAFQAWCEAWATLLMPAMKPGAYLLAFGGTRTHHRLVCGLEDAGFEIHDTIHWLYGTGYPKHKSKLKPAHEPIVVARKSAKVATPLQIESGRIHVTDPHYARNCAGDRGHAENRSRASGFKMGCGKASSGRWPANVCMSCECEDVAPGEGHLPGCPVRELGEQSGEKTSGYMKPGQKRVASRGLGGYGDGFPDEASGAGTYGDTGTAARFYYCGKASRADRNEGCEGMEAKASGMMQDDAYQWPGTETHSPHKTPPAANHHPTVKATALMQWLCRLVTPAGGTALDPFMGSGSTGKACVREGFNFVGIEGEAEYLEIARRRIEHEQAKTALFV
jgi:site-specific DNA-methyltransferase (adenine-specific)